MPTIRPNQAYSNIKKEAECVCPPRLIIDPIMNRKCRRMANELKGHYVKDLCELTPSCSDSKEPGKRIYRPTSLLLINKDMREKLQFVLSFFSLDPYMIHIYIL